MPPKPADLPGGPLQMIDSEFEASMVGEVRMVLPPSTVAVDVVGEVALAGARLRARSPCREQSQQV